MQLHSFPWSRVWKHHLWMCLGPNSSQQSHMHPCIVTSGFPILLQWAAYVLVGIQVSFISGISFNSAWRAQKYPAGPNPESDILEYCSSFCLDLCFPPLQMLAWVHEDGWCEITDCLCMVFQGCPSIWNSGGSARFVSFRSSDLSCNRLCCRKDLMPPFCAPAYPEVLPSGSSADGRRRLYLCRDLNNEKPGDPCSPQEGSCQSERLSQWRYKHMECMMQVLIFKPSNSISAMHWHHGLHLQEVFILTGVSWQMSK